MEDQYSDAFLEWYDKKFPEHKWDFKGKFIYDSIYEYVDRDQHKALVYQGWIAGLKHCGLNHANNENWYLQHDVYKEYQTETYRTGGLGNRIKPTGFSRRSGSKGNLCCKPSRS